MFSILNSKKANVFIEIVYLIIIGMAISLMVFSGYKIFGEMNTDIQQDNTLSQTTKNTTQNLYDHYPSTMDNAFLIILVLVWVVVLVAAFLIDTHPIFFIFSAILLLFILVIAGVISNTYTDVNTDSEFNNIGDNFPIINFIMQNLVVVILIMGASVLLVLFAKNRFMT